MKMEKAKRVRQMRINQKRMRLFGVAVAIAIDLDFIWWSFSEVNFLFLMVGSVVLVLLVYMFWRIYKKPIRLTSF
ncbi:MAG: hypothetical protein ACE5IO_08190 [Thermoplasmata archaeon]